MYKFIGDFSKLEELGFITDKYKRYYYLPLHFVSNKFLSPLTIDIKTRRIEYIYHYQLDIIKDYIEKIG